MSPVVDLRERISEMGAIWKQFASAYMKVEEALSLSFTFAPKSEPLTRIFRGGLCLSCGEQRYQRLLSSQVPGIQSFPVMLALPRHLKGDKIGRIRSDLLPALLL